MEKLNENKVPPLFGVLILIFCFSYLLLVSQYDKVVEYEVVDGDGEKTVQTWKSRGQDIFFFDEKGVKYASLSYSSLKDSYTEKYTIDETITVNRYTVSPEESTLNESIKGGSLYIDSNGVHGEILLLSSVKSKRALDGRIIHVTVSGEDGNFHIIRKLYDGENSNYFLPDEIVEEIVSQGALVNTVRYVAKGRKVVPMSYKSGISL